ncbi:SRPBCC family protein [Microbacterium deminutum]|uniref:SRPBCC family protein n=2 Tax=Microbacterium deminutum TaxID=344164 RepID=A0ABN2QJP2_9MICO
MASRVIDASPEALYDAFTDRDALAVWLPPTGMTGSFEYFDLRPGGGYRMRLTYQGEGVGKTTSDTDVVEARFVELAPGEHVVQEVEFVAHDPAYAGTMVMTWSLEPVDGGTLVTFRADDVPPGISAEDHAAGFAASLANLARYAERAVET